ncbi:site-specific DNA-methyltransferase [Flavobacterium sasangense]|uniref:site-specific DNA-methyltransferase n=1 Tax=Flavobacterium sasangense TaxID=503361 RepID=UPI00047C08C1|nr:site-specific DNA-methyltransferase [Flavobacterium sasangense]
MAQTYKEHLQSLLLKDDRVKDEQGELKGNVVKELANKLDENLIETLLQDDKSREKFFLKIKDVYVFKANDFKFYLEQNSLDNSFTNYANQIGLTLNGKFLKDNTDVVLDFPYKDCILEGGQSTEEGLDTFYEYDDEKEDYTEKQSKRKEIFYNTIVAKDEIDRLLEPKAFENITKYDANGDSKPSQFKRNKEGVITDNLIIKGNNLLALHSLKEEFKGRIKLIYIDPPYNTGSDSFAYNDNFNHSSWLTFMQNRLEIAKDLLCSDGLIFVHCDDNEHAYLKILMDSIFKNENFINTIVMKTINPNGIKTTHATKTILKVKELILSYKKNEIKLKPQYKSIDKYDKFYDLYIEGDLNDLNKCIVIKLKDKIKSLGLKFDLKDEKFKEFIIDNSEKIFQTKFDKRVQNDPKYSDGKLYRYEENDGYYVYQKRFGLKLSKTIKEVFGTKEVGILLGDVWDDFKLNNLYLEGDVSFSNAKKPEHLIYRLIDMCTNENEIVLDYHLGSGTTAAVAQKMGRQYIGIEQMDYVEDVAIERLKKVINGEQGGVSKAVNWQGGGSFVYLELAKNNQKAIEQIQNCNSYAELIVLFDVLYTKYFMHYNVKIKAFKEVISKEENFINLSLERQKEIFCRMLDNNQLYVNRDEMEASNYGLSKEDIALTKDFYQIKE